MYWDWYKQRETFIDNPVLPADYGGYSPKQLSVSRKYQSYKEEILSHLDIQMYHDLVITKAKEYMETERVKDIVANSLSDVAGSIMTYMYTNNNIVYYERYIVL